MDIIIVRENGMTTKALLFHNFADLQFIEEAKKLGVIFDDDIAEGIGNTDTEINKLSTFVEQQLSGTGKEIEWLEAEPEDNEDEEDEEEEEDHFETFSNILKPKQ